MPTYVVKIKFMLTQQQFELHGDDRGRFLDHHRRLHSSLALCHDYCNRQIKSCVNWSEQNFQDDISALNINVRDYSKNVINNTSGSSRLNNVPVYDTNQYTEA